MIKCSECGKEISDTAPVCIGCGAPIAVASGKGAKDYLDKSKEMLTKTLDEASKLSRTALEEVAELSRKALKSQAEKDAEAVKLMAQQFDNQPPAEKSESKINCDKFKAALESTIDLKFAEILQSKPDSDKYLNYVEAQILTASVRNIFKTILTLTPPQVDAACMLSEAILAPSAQEKQDQLKAAIGLAGGTAGIGMVIAGIGVALGWGAGIVASVTAVFVGPSFAGPAGLILAGVMAAGIAGYFATTSNKHTDTERFVKVLKSSTSKAVEAIWAEHGEALSKAANNAGTK